VEEHLMRGNIVPELWRGRMAMEPEHQLAAAPQPSADN
jgi:hypothetical protein